MPAIRIQSDDGRSSARILPEVGFNCFEWKIDDADHEVNVIWAQPDFDQGQQRASSAGIPLLFPFPGRIQHAKFSWQGKDYVLTEGDHRGNAIHGFVFNRPWQVTEKELESVTGCFRSSDFGDELKNQWPSPFEIEVTYHLKTATCLESLICVRNPGTQGLPFGIGLHPYFRTPFDDRELNKYRLHCPIHEEWELKDLIPTGRVHPVPNPADFRTGLDVDTASFDSVFGKASEKPAHEFSINSDRHKLVVEFDRAQFPYTVVYTPGHKEAICIEPYSCVPNPFTLKEQGIDSGLNVLEPGAQWKTTVRYKLFTTH
jgi:aldose 1-epimerase